MHLHLLGLVGLDGLEDGGFAAQAVQIANCAYSAARQHLPH